MLVRREESWLALFSWRINSYAVLRDKTLQEDKEMKITNNVKILIRLFTTEAETMIRQETVALLLLRYTSLIKQNVTRCTWKPRAPKPPPAIQLFLKK